MASGAPAPGAPLSFTAEQLLAAVIGGPGSSAPLHEAVVALLERGRSAADAAAGAELAAIEAAVRDRLSRGERGEAVSRDRIAADASRRAGEQGGDVAGSADVAAALLALAGAAAAPGPAPAVEQAGPPEPAELPAPAGRPRVFRLFVSSTFKDLEQERNVLHATVYPALRELCAARGARFLPIDLRWGVSEEASLDQQAMNICLGEIERCREATPRPNFLVLLGNRYGWLAPAPQIAAEDFERIVGRVAADDRELLERWYARDDNAVPPRYRLLPRERGGPYEAYEAWEPVEARLRAILVAAVAGTELEDDPRFGASATEQEIVAGALTIGAPEGRAHCVAREILLGADDPDPARAAPGDPVLTFVDADQGALADLKRRLADNGLAPMTYDARWDRERGAPTTEHLARLAADVEAALRAAIDEELRHPLVLGGEAETRLRIEPDEQLDAEGNAHRRFAAERIRFFVGRDDLLRAIGEYLAAGDPLPLVVHGAGGTGKSALMAEALRRAQDRPETQLVYRFVGATPASSDGRALLQGICRELARRYGGDEAAVPSDYQELAADLRERLALARADRPLVLMVDSLDQLSAAHGARRLAWIPDRLPEHVRLLVSTRSGDTLDPLRLRLEHAAATGTRMVEVGPLSRGDGDELLGLWLADAGRALRPDQAAAVLDAFEASAGNPLYLRLAFGEARRWTSDEAPEPLAPGIEGIIAQNTFARLAHEDNHGEVLVSHALAYLAASRHGLAEDELLDLLSRDPEVYGWFMRDVATFHLPVDLRDRLAAHLPGGADPAAWLREIREGARSSGELDDFLARALPERGAQSLRLPVVLWSRLYADLAPYLTESAAEDAVLIGFYHRELGDVATSRYLGGAEAGVHRRIAEYFRPEPGADGAREWREATRHGLAELPYHLTRAERWDDLAETLTDFGFLEEKASRVGVERSRGAQGEEVVSYTGVFALQEDYERALAAMAGGAAAGPGRPLIVTATDFGDGPVVRCPHCHAAHAFERECEACGKAHRLDDWRGHDLPCPSEGCGRPLRVNEFVVAPRAAERR